MKTNCWEFKKCGREPGGSRINEFGVCLAAFEQSVSGVNNGKNGGRCCWAIAGTICGGKLQGVFAEEVINCAVCDFFKIVIKEEYNDFKPAAEVQVIL